MKVARLVLLAIFAWCCCWSKASGQVVISPTYAPEALIACGAPDGFKLQLINGSPADLSGSQFVITFPQGMRYVPGSATGPLIELDLSNLEQPRFEVAELPALSFRPIAFDATINCSFVNDEPVHYTLWAGAQAYHAQEQPLGNFFFPEVVITAATDVVLELPVGGMGSRSFTIIQATQGASLDTLFFVNRYEAGIERVSLSVGNLIGSGPTGDTLAIFGDELPGGDGFFDFGDTLVVTETVRLLGCLQQNSAIDLYWRCGEALCQIFTLQTLVSPASGLPHLQIVNSSGFASQAQANDPARVGGGFCQTLVLDYEIANTGSESLPGTGTVYDLTVGLGLNGNLFSSVLPIDIALFPAWAIRAQINGVAIPISPYAFPLGTPLLGYNLRFSALSSNPDGPGGLEDVDGDGFFDDLPPGASFRLQVLIDYDPEQVEACGFLSGLSAQGGAETALRVGYYYRDQCGSPIEHWYSVADTGMNVVGLFTHRDGDFIAQLAHSNLMEGQETWLEILPGGAWRSPCSATDSIVLELILPPGLRATGVSSGPGQHYGIVEQRGDTVWLAGSERSLTGQPWRLRVAAVCGIPIGNSLRLSFWYYCSPECPMAKRIDCQDVSLEFLVQCEMGQAGIGTRGFTVERRTLGWRDVQHSARVDPQADTTINLKAAINFDSVEMRLEGVYRGTGPYGGLMARIAYHPIDSTLVNPAAPHFLPLGAVMRYFSADGELSICELDGFSLNYDPALRYHTLSLEMETLFAPGVGCLEHIDRQAGDSLSLSIFVLVSDNTPRRASWVPELSGELFSLLDGQEVRGARYLAVFMLEEVVPAAYVQYVPQIHYGCEAIRFNSNAVANKGHAFDGDQFPDEVRSAAAVSQIRVKLGGAWHIVPGSSQLVAAGSFDKNGQPSLAAPGALAAIADPIVSYDGDATLLTYINPGDWPMGDLAIGGSNALHDIHFSARPSCGVPDQGAFIIEVAADMVRYPDALLPWRDTLVSLDSSFAKQYRPPQAALLLASVQEFIPVNDTVEWSFRLENTTVYAGADKTLQYGWIAIEAGQGFELLSLEELTGLSSPTVHLPAWQDENRYWFEIGSLAAFSSRRFHLVGRYRECSRLALRLYFGSSCTGYPNPQTGYQVVGTSLQCPTISRNLSVQPAEVSLALAVIEPPLTPELCQALDYALLVTNLQLPNTYRHQVDAVLPPGAQVVAGSSRVEYPAGSGQWVELPDPEVLPGNTWTWDLSLAIAWLTGVNRPSGNQYQLSFQVITDCSFTAGLRLGFRASASSICGASVERTAFSRRLQIAGVPAYTNNYGLDIHLPEHGLKACGMAPLELSILNLGPFETTELELAAVTLPSNFVVVPGPLPAGVALISDESDDLTRRLLFTMPPGVEPGGMVRFRLDVRDEGNQELPCDSVELSLGVLVQTEVRCMSIPEGQCDILFFVNADSLRTPILKDDWGFELLSVESVPYPPGGELVTVEVELCNRGLHPVQGDSIRWLIYHSAAEGSNSLALSLERRLPPLGILDCVRDTFSFYAPTEEVCGLLLSAQNTGASCLCEPLPLHPLPSPRLRNVALQAEVCSGGALVLGTDFREDNISYQWQLVTGSAGSLSDETVAQPVFQAENQSAVPQQNVYVLQSVRPGGCASQDTAVVTVWPELQVAAILQQDYNGYSVSCHGRSDGSVALELNVGAQPALYEWQGQVQTHPVFEGLPAGAHRFVIIDGRACQAAVEVLLSEPAELELLLEPQAVSCHEGADGSAIATAVGGVPPYVFTWSAGEGVASLSTGLTAGLVGVTVEDANACQVAAWEMVQAPDSIVYQLLIDSAACAYSADGAARLEGLQGGTPPYAIHWDGQTGAAAVAGLGAGWHHLLIKDAQGCITLDSFWVPAPLPVTAVMVEQQDARCFGSEDGALRVVLSGGIGPYQTLWSDGSQGVDLSNLAAGSYSLWVEDAQGCSYVFNDYHIGSPPPINLAELWRADVSCHGLADGQIQVAASGGTAPYVYRWQHGPKGARLEGLPKGQYWVAVTDAHGCIDSLPVSIGEPLPLDVSYELSLPGCAGQDGQVRLQPAGGVPPYRFAVGDAGFAVTAWLELPQGAHLLRLQDANGCLWEDEIEMPAPPPILLSLPAELRVNYGDTVRVWVEVANAIGELWVQWRPDIEGLSCQDCLAPVFSLSESTVFYVRVVDEQGCEAEARLSIVVEKPRRLFIPNAFSPNGDGHNDHFYPHAAPEVSEISRLEIFDRWGSQVFKNHHFAPGQPVHGWDGTQRGQPAAVGVYVYFLEALFRDGKRQLFKGELYLVR